MGRARAMLIQAGSNPKEKGEFWCEVISIATNMDNIMVRPDRTKPPFTLFYIRINRSLLPSGGLMADVPCLDHSLDG